MACVVLLSTEQLGGVAGKFLKTYMWGVGTNGGWKIEHVDIAYNNLGIMNNYVLSIKSNESKL